MKEFNIISLFSGIGAPEEALRQMGVKHKILLACDNNKYCKDTYLTNNIVKNGVNTIKQVNKDGGGLGGNVDLLIGGPPCQSFSVAGKRKGLKDERGVLIFDFLNSVKLFMPKIFILENVPGLLTVSNKEVGKKIEMYLIYLCNIGYQIDGKVLNAAEYGSVSIRKRLFIIGKKGEMFNGPEPTKNLKYLSSCLENTPNENEIKIFPVKECMGNKKGKKSVNGVVSTKHPFGKFELDNTIYCKSGKIITLATAGNRPKIYDGMVVRILSVREKLRIMGFGENFIPNENKYQAYKQVGNSMSVDCLKAIFKSLGIEGETNDR